MKWIWTYPAVCVPGTTSWELLLGEAACKSRGMVKSNKGLVSVTDTNCLVCFICT